MTARLLAFVLASFLAAPLARADSPLTSTPFHEAYGDHPAVAHARGAQVLDAATLESLRDPSIPHDVRAAIVNALGWRFYAEPRAARAHARTFLEHVAAAHHKPAGALRMDELSSEELLALGYLAAMDRYQDLGAIGGVGEVERALPRTLLDEAWRRAPGDATIAMVRGLVRAQAQIERREISDAQRVQRGFCNVWLAYEATTRSPSNLRAQAREIVDSYMRGYRGYCSRG